MTTAHKVANIKEEANEELFEFTRMGTAQTVGRQIKKKSLIYFPPDADSLH